MAAFWRDLGRILNTINSKNRGANPQSLYERLRKRGRSAERAARVVGQLVEALEDRRMLAVIPAPTVLSRFDLAAPSGPPADYVSKSNPSIVVDPVDPNKMVAVWVSDEPWRPGDRQQVFVQGRYTTDAGQTWAAFVVPGNTIDPISDPATPIPFLQAVEPSLAMDRDQNVYLVYRERNLADSAGRVVLQKYDFSGNAMVRQTNTTTFTLGAYTNLYSWYNPITPPYQAAYMPTIAVDANVPMYIDPADPTKVLNDPYVGNVYVAWAMNDQPPYDVGGWNPNSIRFATSSDGAAVFGPSTFVNENGAGNFGDDRNTMPRIVVSQGTLDGRVKPGHVTIVWDNFNYSNNPPRDALMADGFDGTRVYTWSHPGGSIMDAIDGDYSGTDVKDYPVGAGPMAMLLGDFDGANGTDILTVNNGADNVSVLRNDGNGAFPDSSDPADPATLPVLTPVDTGPTWAVLGDFVTGPGLEVAVLCSTAKLVNILTNPVAGAFTVLAGKPATGTNPVHAVAADYNGDGNIDLIIAENGDATAADLGQVRLLPGDGTGAFGAAVTLTQAANGIGDYPTAVAAQDFDGDGNIDIAVTTSRTVGATTTYYVDVLLGDGLGGFTFYESYAVGTNPVQMIADRLEGAGDGTWDLAVTNNGSNDVSVLLGIGDGSFKAARQVAAGLTPRGISTLDLDADTIPDVLMVTNESSGQISLLFHGGGGLWMRLLTGSVGAMPSAAGSLGDLNTDGMPELAIASFGGSNVRVLTSGTSSSGSVLPRSTAFPVDVDIADPYFVLGDLDIELSLGASDVAGLRVDLISPTGDIVPLVLNRLDAAGNELPGQPFPPQGLTGKGIGYRDGSRLPTIFDAESNIGIKDRNAAEPWTGHFRPETGNLASLYGKTAADMQGTWMLVVTDYQKNDSAQDPQWVYGFTMKVQPTVTWMGNRVIVGDAAKGAITSPYPNPGGNTPSPARGIGPTFSLASDNTLGAFSPYQGRIYLAYTAGEGDDTNIYLVTTDNAFRTLTNFGILPVHDDSAADGYSGGNKAQFQPEIAVDQTTGTLVVSFYDARHDGARARVARYIATSIDGGWTFGPQMFVNVPWMAVDGITLEAKVLGPVPDNQSAGNPEADANFGFGDRQGLAAVNGHIFPVWAGNRNDVGSYNGGSRLGILGADVVMTSGPRIISSTMGPVGTKADLVNPAQSGSPVFRYIRVVFDRPIDPTTFTPADIEVRYRTVNQTGNDPGTVVPVSRILPVVTVPVYPYPPGTNPNLGITTFDVELLTPQTATGTYSYAISPSVNDRIRLAIPMLGAPRVYSPRGVNANMRVPSVGTGGQTNPNFLTQNFTTSVISVSGESASDVIADINVQVWLAHSAVGDLVLRLIAPDGTIVLLSDQNGGATADYMATLFDDEALLPIDDPTAAAPYTGSFQPQDPAGLAALIGMGLNGDWKLEIEDTTKLNQGVLYSWTMWVRTAAVFTPAPAELNKVIPPTGTGGTGVVADDVTKSTLTIAGVPANNLIEDVNVNVTLTHGDIGDLILTLVAPDGKTRIPLAVRRGAGGTDYTSTRFDDQATVRIDDPAAVAPFTGSFIPETLLSLLNGMRVNGNWVLEIHDTTANNTGTLVSWSLEIRTGTGNLGDQNGNAVKEESPVAYAPPVPPLTVPTGSLGDMYVVPTPPRTGFNGTYYVPMSEGFDQDTLPVIVPGPHVVNTYVSAIYPAPKKQAGLVIPPLNSGGSLVPTDNTTVARLTMVAGPAATITDLNVRLTLNHTKDSDLKITLFGPDGTFVVLVDGAGGVGQNFVNTLFDDDAAGPIAGGTAPFTGTFRPQAAMSGFNGKVLNGVWRLEVVDRAAGNTGSLASWTLLAKTSAGDITRGVTYSQYTVSANPNQTINDLNAYLTLSHTPVGDLKVTLIAPDGTAVVLADAVGAAGAGFVSTVFNDQATTAIAVGAAPFTGAFRPTQALNAFVGKLLRGAWTLQIEDAADGNTGSIVSWALEAQTTNPTTGENLLLDTTLSSIDILFDRDMDPASMTTLDPATKRPLAILRMMGPLGQLPFDDEYTVTPNPLGSDPDPAYPRTYRIGFPKQELSGTYTITLASSVKSKLGEELDTNLNAGVQMLRRMASLAKPDTVPILFPSTAGVKAITPGVVTESTITIPPEKAFKIYGAKLQLDVTYENDPDLEAVLIAPDGTVMSLFWGLPPTKRTDTGKPNDMDQTVLDDRAITPIENGAAPFRGFFRSRPNGLLTPYTLSRTYLAGQEMNTTGTWRLQIRTKSATLAGALNGWSLTFDKALPTTGLGEFVADQVTVSARVFTQDPTNPLTHNVWTSIGPSSNNNGGNAGRISGLAVDPSDPSMNTVYLGGASGGVWKTTNFMTADSRGPTWIPLTDFGPVFSMNIGSIAVFGRNKDPNQSIIYAGTGEGDVGTTGVGFLRSMDGGANWELLDSTVNFDPVTGAYLPISSPLRDHRFVGTTIWKVVVDPKFTPSGDVFIYAAVWDPTFIAGTTPPAQNRGGIWRSLDSGRTWVQMRAGSGNASDVVLDENSGYYDQYTNTKGNLQYLYAAFEGEGVFFSQNRGQMWTLMAGTVGVPNLIDRYSYPGYPAIIVDHPGVPDYTGFDPYNAPNGANVQRIVMAKPALTGDNELDTRYQGWLYAAAVHRVTYVPTGVIVDFASVYVTKDYGDTWTRIRIPLGSNDTRLPEYDLGSNYGNYNLSIAVDPTNPSVVYVGGYGSGFVRIDITNLSDSHAAFRNSDRSDGGLLGAGGPDPYTPNPVPPGANPAWDPYLNKITPLRPTDPSVPPAQRLYGGFTNLLHDPWQAFDTGGTVLVGDIYRFANSGAGAKNMRFSSPYFGAVASLQHRLLTVKDPVTGHSRLIFGDDRGVKTAVDLGDGTVTLGIDMAEAVWGDRNGNLGITQFFYGAAQPSSLAAQAANSMFYGNSYHNGYPASDWDILTTGDLNWVGDSAVNPYQGSGAGVATDQTGTGMIYRLKWPEGVFPPVPLTAYLNNYKDFFQVYPAGSREPSGMYPQTIYVGRTIGLLQTTQDGAINPMTEDRQWSDFYTPLTTYSNIAVNPVSGDQIIVSSSVGRIFGTENQGRRWVEIGNPTALDGTYAPALAYGAPDPKGPGGPDTTNFFLYVGTMGGKIFVTFTGGGTNGNAWTDLSRGLDGSAVRSIVTNPMRGTHEAYAVTNRGIYHMPDSMAFNATWTNITGNVFTLAHHPFYTKYGSDADDADNAETAEFAARQLTAIQADWRYVIPDDMGNPTGSTHPMLYVSSFSGVYRSEDNGLSWTRFPEESSNVPTGGGYLPMVQVTDLDMTLGSLDPTNGREDANNPDGIRGRANALVASTFGRGAFAIRLAPMVVKSTVAMDPATDTGTMNNDMVTTDPQPIFEGMSQQSAYGNHVRISILDMTDPNNPVVIGGFSGTFGDATDLPTSGNYTDEFGRFRVRIYPNTLTERQYKIGIRATDDGGVVGQIVLLDTNLTFDKTPAQPVIGQPPVSIIVPEGNTFSGVVASFNDISSQCTATINWGDGTSSPGAIKPNPGGWFDVEGTHTYATTGTFQISVTVIDPAGNNSTAIPASATVSNPQILPAGGLQYSVNEGDNFAKQPVATFTDPGGAQALASYTATIDWGDGTSSAGEIAYDTATGIFTVLGGHFFPDSGVRTITTTIKHETLPTVTATSAMTVLNVVPVPTFSGPAAAFATFATTFTIGASDVSPADNAVGFTYSINWGDGSANTVIAVSAGNGASRTVTHAYAAVGTYQATLTVTDKDGGAGVSAPVTIEVVDPNSMRDVVINKGERQRSIIKTISFKPSYNGAPISSFSTKNLRLMYNGSTPVSLKGVKIAYKGGVATVNMSRMALRDGDFQLQVTLGPGQVRSIDFHKLGGDTDGDRAVGKRDWGVVKRGMGYRYRQAGYDVNADLDGSSKVDATDLRICRYNYGRTLAGYRMKALLYPGKAKLPTIKFGNLAANSNLKIVDLAFYNMGKTGTMRLRNMRLAGGSGTFSFGVPGSLWQPTTGAFAIAAGRALNTRIYLTPGAPQAASNTLVFEYSLDGVRFLKGSIKLSANIG